MLQNTKNPPRLILAPMEGVMDAIMREQLTAIGGYERCVTCLLYTSPSPRDS